MPNKQINQVKKIAFSILYLLSGVALHAQDYIIKFSGIGENGLFSEVGVIGETYFQVENRTQGTSLSLFGTEALHLMGTITSIVPSPIQDKTFNIYPNPTANNSTIEFFASTSGIVNVEIYDITGKRVIAMKNTLAIGTHSYMIRSSPKGIYTARISGNGFAYAGKLISNGTASSGIKISYLGNTIIPVPSNFLKSAYTEKIMQYNSGDLLKITGLYRGYRTTIIDVPTKSKTLTLNFGECRDADYNLYPLAQIGTQIWMAEDLRTTKYSDGTNIPNVTKPDIYSWERLETGVYCTNSNNPPIGWYKYGKLYNWYAVNNSRKIAPVGWHVASDAEWAALETYLSTNLGNSGNVAKALASEIDWVTTTTSGTIGYQTWTNNSSGFTALPGSDTGNSCVWWTSTAGDKNYVLGRYIRTGRNNVSKIQLEKYSGCSVRCIKD